ncbi:MAG: VWA domain-containing protein [Erysipelotrichaceae bacterium]|nr:VWA domain-containing protein [Erysipelotrichaceae bacterium]
MSVYQNRRFSYDYEVDICLVIDRTGSMRPILDTVKNNAVNLHRDIKTRMEMKGKTVSALRVRVIAFGDYAADGPEAIVGSDFMVLPEQTMDLEDCVEGIRAEGGGDIPEDGLEALAFAIRSKWTRGSGKRRHIICLFTDAPVHDLGFGAQAEGYPLSAPKTYEELSAMWGFTQYPGEMDTYAKRLLLFAPDEGWWQRIRTEWENTILRPAARDTGLQDVSYTEMLDTIANSI